jgi:hypothetical protein
MVRGGNRSAADITRAVDTLIGWARRDEAAGVRRDRILFDFEARFEEISDEIAKLSDKGEAEAYRDIYAKLYTFADEMMADSYMPLYLYLLYRYAQALLDAGQPEAALERFQALYDGTERLIGVNNSYGISCLERVAAAAGQAGQKTVAAAAMEAMRRTAREAFEENSAMALAVERIVKA